MKYICPMHAEITQDKTGNCPICGMKLIVDDSERSSSHHVTSEQQTWRSYFPLFTIIGLILLTTLTLSLKDVWTSSFTLPTSLSYFMIGFFLILVDLNY